MQRSARREDDLTRAIRRVLAPAIALGVLTVGPATAAPVWRVERTTACRALVRATASSLPAHATRADHRAYLDRVLRVGIAPALTALGRGVPVSAQYRAQRAKAIAVLRRWRASARVSLAGGNLTSGADRRALLMARAALALSVDRNPCRIPVGSERSTPVDMTVPDVRGEAPDAAYALLRSRGLRLAIPDGWIAYPMAEPIVWMQYPPAGTPVPAGAAVTVAMGWGPSGSPGIGPQIPTAVVPVLVGGTVGAARHWALATGQLVQTTFAPLPPTATAATLEDDYVVTAQSPAPGAPIAFGVPIDHGIRLTPVHIHAAIRR